MGHFKVMFLRILFFNDFTFDCTFQSFATDKVKKTMTLCNLSAIAKELSGCSGCFERTAYVYRELMIVYCKGCFLEFCSPVLKCPNKDSRSLHKHAES